MTVGAAVGLGSLALLSPATFLNLLCVGIVTTIVVGHLRRTHPLLSLRNIFLVGFVLFQAMSVSKALSSGDFGPFTIVHPDGTGRTFAVFSVVFLGGFFIAYQRPTGRGLAIRAGAKILVTEREPRGSLAPLAVILVALAALFRASASFLPVALANGSVLFAISLCAVASSLAAWEFGRVGRRLRASFVCLLTVALSIPIAITGQFGRRPLVAIFAGVMWSLYYRRWHMYSSKRALLSIAALSLVPLVAIGLFSDVRSAGSVNRSSSDYLTAAVESGNIIAGLEGLVEDFPTGTVSMWAIESYPDRNTPRYLQSIRYFVTLPIPRQIYEGKGVPLANLVAKQADLSGVDQDRIKIPAGIIGNAAAEGGLAVALVYGLAIGLLLRFFDEIVRQGRRNPLVVVAVGCNLGQILGLARGEPSVFAGVFVLSVVAVRFFLLALEHLVSRRLAAASTRALNSESSGLVTNR